MPKPSKYKSIGVGIDTYEKIVHLAHEERRNISQQLALLVDEEYRMRELRKADLPAKLRKKYVGGLSAVIED